MSMNQSDIEGWASNHHACPNVKRGVQILYALLRIVNDQSDGWAYWSAPRRAAEPLMALLKTAGSVWAPTHGTITREELRKAITPIKSMMTKQKKLQLKYGNRLDWTAVYTAIGDL